MARDFMAKCPVCGGPKEAGIGFRYDSKATNGCCVVIRASRGPWPVCSKCSIEAVKEVAESILAGEIEYC